MENITPQQPEPLTPIKDVPHKSAAVKILVAIIVSVIVTAVVTGVGAYLWQQQSARKTQIALEQRVASLEESLSRTQATPTNLVVVPVAPPAISIAPTISPGTNSDWQTYSNSTYHFTMKLPKEIYSTNCRVSQPVQINDNGNQIELGAKFNCPEQDPTFLQGWTLYASNNVTDVQTANNFLQNILGYKDCKTVMEEGNLLIMPVNDAPLSCTVITGKAGGGWSQKYGTWVFWDYTQQPEFTTQTGSNDDQITFSFN